MSVLLKRIVVKNVGVLKAFTTPRAPQFERLTSFYARNGRGKTTLATILRSASTNDPDAIHGRRTLGQNGVDPAIVLTFEDRIIRFADGRWQEPINRMDVFDGDFISSNLYAGESVDLVHDRALFTIILGKAGVKLAKHQEYFVAAARRTGQALKAAETALKDDLPTNLSRDEFLAFTPDSELDRHIEQAAKDLKGVQQVDRLSKLPKLQPISMPTIEPNFVELLTRTVADIEASARDHLAAHFKKFKLGKQGEAWVKYGREHIEDDACPFCGKADVGETGLVAIYTKIFGEAYKLHFDAIKVAADQINEDFGPDAQTALAATGQTNAETVVSWSEFYALDDIRLPTLGGLIDGLATAYQALKTPVEEKRQSPLVVIRNDEAFRIAVAALDRGAQSVAAYNKAISELDRLVETKRRETTLTEAQARERLSNLMRCKNRNDPGVRARITNAVACKRQDTRAKKIRSLVQARLKQKNEESAAHYHTQVNRYLEKFDTKFRISAITNSMVGNAGSVDYGLIVRGHRVARGRGRTIRDEPTFMNTLSTGDKTTLAFAFFLADIDRQNPGEMNERVVVFDDPLSSHDMHRRARTVDILYDLSQRCGQVIVFSHDAYFLRKVHRRCSRLSSVSYEIKFDGLENWSQAATADLAELCESEHARQLRTLLSYYHHRTAKPYEMAPLIRTVLETHFRTAYPFYFGHADLGTIVKNIKDYGPTHPCWNNYADLDSCNVHTVHQHHGDDPSTRANEPIDQDELYSLVKTCLLLVHAVPPNS